MTRAKSCNDESVAIFKIGKQGLLSSAGHAISSVHGEQGDWDVLDVEVRVLHGSKGRGPDFGRVEARGKRADKAHLAASRLKAIGSRYLANTISVRRAMQA